MVYIWNDFKLFKPYSMGSLLASQKFSFLTISLCFMGSDSFNIWIQHTQLIFSPAYKYRQVLKNNLFLTFSSPVSQMWNSIFNISLVIPGRKEVSHQMRCGPVEPWSVTIKICRRNQLCQSKALFLPRFSIPKEWMNSVSRKHDKI